MYANHFYHPGVGAIYMRRRPRVRIEALISGGGQERGIRSGTVPTPLVVGLGAACQTANEEMARDAAKIRKLSDRLVNGISAKLPHVIRNGDSVNGYPGCVNLSFAFVEGESLLMALKDMALSSGSACTSSSLEPSYVLRALGTEEDLAHSSIRFGIGTKLQTDILPFHHYLSVFYFYFILFYFFNFILVRLQDASPPKRRSTTASSGASSTSSAFARCRHCGRCSKRVLTSRASNGRSTNAPKTQPTFVKKKERKKEKKKGTTVSVLLYKKLFSFASISEKLDGSLAAGGKDVVRMAGD